MAMSNAQRQRKFRLNRDKGPEKRANYLGKQKEKYKKDKATGKKKCVKDMTEREKRSARRKWRIERRERRKKEKEIRKILTPPNSPMTPEPVERPAKPSRQKVHSMKKTEKHRAKCYRDIDILQAKLNSAEKKALLYKKRWERILDKQQRAADSHDTPRTKTRKLLGHFPKKEIRKTLCFHNALIDQLKLSYARTTKAVEKQHIQRILTGSIMRKYKQKSVALTICDVHSKNKMKERACLSRNVFKTVRDFFERDDVSRVVAGLKNTVTSKKVKKQRRILNDTMKNLHSKFLSEVSFKISRTTFSRLKQFWVSFPADRDRNTCQCRLCENTKFIASSLKECGVTNTDNLDSLLEEIVCNTSEKKCMYNECSKCEGSHQLNFNEDRLSGTSKWWEWTIKRETRAVELGQKLQEEEVSYRVKELVSGTTSELFQKFEQAMMKYKKHSFNIQNQYKYYQKRKQTLESNECVIHIDFSENYCCKLASEIQSMHFGASKRQVTLHTGIYHTSTSSQTFCTVSDSLHHGPGAIWAHLKPILGKIKATNPEITKIDIFSDGPTAQYKQKGNFYLFSTELVRLGFEQASWNFFEASHGKGVPDAVGGAMKRNADRKVKYGCDISCAKDC